mgnify:CR=1 FL=1
MNKIISIIGIFVILGFSVSCYKDLSTSARGEYPEIDLNVSDDSESIYVGYGDYLKLESNAKQLGVPDEDLEYSWKIGYFINSQYESLEEISKEHSINIQIVNTPSNDPYYVSLTVTNKNDGYNRSKCWKLYVSSTLGDGLLVAHTKDGGSTSILSLVTAKPLSFGYSSDDYRVVNDVYGLANDGKAIKGRVHSLLSRMCTYIERPNPKSFSDYRVMVATDDTLRMLNPLQYKAEEFNEALFSGKMKFNNFKADTVFNLATCASCALMDGYLYACAEVMGYQYTPVSVSINPSDRIFTTRNTSAVPASQGYLAVFNPTDGCFYGAHGVFITQSSVSVIDPPVSPSPSDMLGKIPVAAGVLDTNCNAFVVKDKSDKYYLVRLYLNNSVAASVIELSLPDVDNAKGWAFCDNANVFYYYTSDAIYSTLVSGSAATTRKLSFKPENPSEKITMLKQYTQAWWGAGQSNTDDPNGLYYYAFPLETNRLQMIIVTFDESSKEGKFYLKPFNVSTGMFSTFKDNGVYGGFGEITAVCSTLK